MTIQTPSLEFTWKFTMNISILHSLLYHIMYEETIFMNKIGRLSLSSTKNPSNTFR